MTARRAIGFVLIVMAACTPGPSREASVPTPGPARSPSPVPAPEFDVARVLDLVRRLAVEIGPREATSVAYGRAAVVVEELLRSFGYRVKRQAFSVPAGQSGGRAVPAGDTFNVLAEPTTFDPGLPHLVIGAHLDTVPQSPGSVDNAAGIGIMIEVARLASDNAPEVPIVFVAFGAEEARVPNGGLFGSRHFVAELDRVRRRALMGAISVDRVGAGSSVPICTGGMGSPSLAERLFAAANRIGVAVTSCTNRSSDHWSFERAGLIAARIGPDEYPEYHTARDTLAVVAQPQLERAGRLLWETVRQMAPP